VPFSETRHTTSIDVSVGSLLRVGQAANPRQLE